MANSSKVGDVDFGPHSVLDLPTEQIRWMDYWLNEEENGVMDIVNSLGALILSVNPWTDK